MSDIPVLEGLGFKKFGERWTLPTFSAPNVPRIPPVLMPVPDDVPKGLGIWAWGPMWAYHVKDGVWVKEQLGGLGQHDGQDFTCAIGTPVRAPCPGLVLRAGWQNPEDPKEGYGKRIMAIARGRQFSGFENPHFWSAHLSDIVVKEDQEFNSGDLLGWTGATGNVEGPHLHMKFAHRFSDEHPLGVPFEVDYLPFARWQAAMQHI